MYFNLVMRKQFLVSHSAYICLHFSFSSKYDSNDSHHISYKRSFFLSEWRENHRFILYLFDSLDSLISPTIASIYSNIFDGVASFYLIVKVIANVDLLWSVL